jgi:hypothetical protein
LYVPGAGPAEPAPSLLVDTEQRGGTSRQRQKAESRKQKPETRNQKPVLSLVA